MHELSVTKGLLDTVLKSAKENNARKVCKVSVVMGDYYDYVPEIVAEYFGLLAEESIASEAELDFETVPVKIYCNRCQKEYEGKRISAIRCLDCGTNDIIVLSGKELYIKDMQIE